MHIFISINFNRDHMPERNLAIVLGLLVAEPKHRDSRILPETVGVEIREKYIAFHLVVLVLCRHFIEEIIEVSSATSDRLEFEWQVVE